MSKRKRGLGVVRFRKDTKKYVTDFYDNLGHRHVKTIGTNHSEALYELEEQRNMKRSPDGINKEVLFQTFAEAWLKRKIVMVKEATQVSYEGIVKNHLIPYFGNANLSEITRANIKDFLKDKVVSGKLKKKTIRNILIVLSEILDEALDDELIANNPYPHKINKQITQITQNQGKSNGKENGDTTFKKIDCLQTNEIILFLNACQDHKEDPQNYSLFYTAIFTGARRGELLALQWGDIDWNRKQIHIRRSLYKTKFQIPKSKYSVRAIDIEDRLLTILKQHRKRQTEIRLRAGSKWVDNDLIFCQKDGSPLDADNLYHRDFHRILKRSGIRRIRIHDLRHTFASILIAAKHSPKYIQNQMGHGSIQITMDLYCHLMEEVHEGAADKTASVIFGSGNVMVTGQEKGVTADSQPLDLFGSGGLI